MNTLTVEKRGFTLTADATDAIDISIPLDFDGAQPNHFDAPPAIAEPLNVGEFVGDTRLGGSCNCEQYRLVPHCNGTHTECVGHVTVDRISVHETLRESLLLATLVTPAVVLRDETEETSWPPPQIGDRLITASAIEQVRHALPDFPTEALIVRTQPNPLDKRERRYETGSPPPFFTIEAIRWMVARDIRHLLVDTPSVDRAHDEGQLSGHRAFWGLPAGAQHVADATRADATITELIFVPDEIEDGHYLLDLQIPPFMTDAAPSRPLLYPLCETT